MAKLLPTSRFIEDAKSIYSARLDVKLSKVLTQLEMFPNSGSSDIPPSIKVKYGNDIKKAVIKPFDLVYLYDEKADVVVLLALIHMRHAK